MRRELQTVLVLLIAISLLTLPCPPVKAASYLQWKRNRIITLANDPYGIFTCRVSMYKLMDDGVAQYDWFYYFLTISTTPGKVVYGSEWCTGVHMAWQRLWPYGTTEEDVVSYGPTTTSGTTGQSITYTVQALLSKDGPSFGGSISYTQSYSISDVTIHDQSCIEPSYDIVCWVHDLKDFAPVSQDTYTACPSFVVIDNGGYCFASAKYYVGWIKGTFLGPILLKTEGKLFESGVVEIDCPA